MSSWTQDAISLPNAPSAEHRVINYGQIYPDQILSLGLAPGDFYDPQRRRLWSAMIAVHLQSGESESGSFYLALLDELRREHHGESTRILESVDATADWQSSSSPDEPAREVRYWIEQVKRCVVARNLIDAASQIAELAYRVPSVYFDVTDASAVLSRVAGVPDEGVIGMEIPV
jgi:replicative DNA helicase